VEDNPADVELTLQYLRKAGYSAQVDVVDNAADFLSKLQLNAYDMVFSDYRLPGWSGMDALEALQKEGREIPFILLSGTVGEEIAVDCIKKGATDFVRKDGLGRLPEVVKRALREQALREEHRRARAAEHASEQRYRALFERNLAGVFRSTVDGRLLDCNQALAEMLGFASCAEAMAAGATALYFSPGEQEAFLARLSHERTLNNVEVRLRKHDGSAIWVLENVTLLGDEEAGVPVLEGTVIDITARKRAEMAAAEWNHRYEAAIRATGQILYEWDPATNTVTYSGNYEELLGYPPQEMSGGLTHWIEFIHPDDREAFKREIERVLATEARFQLEYRVRKTDGAYLIVHDNAYFYQNSADHTSRMVGFVTDITERKQLEAQLLHAQKMESVGQLAGGVAHDFNNLLTVICGYAELVLRRLPANSKERGNVEAINQAGIRAAVLTHQLLAFSRKQVLALQVLDLNEVVSNTDQMLRRLIGDHIELVTHLQPGPARVKADAGQLEQVIMNLAVNARDAMPQGGKLRSGFINA